MLVFPRVWSNDYTCNIEFLSDEVNWRFSGGFFIGDKHSLIDMWKIYKSYFKKFISETNKIV
jgi:hypothetical protein